MPDDRSPRRRASRPPRALSRPIETLGVARALDHVRDNAVETMRAWFVEQRTNGRLEIAEDMIETVLLRFGRAAREAAGTGVAEAFQVGVNRTATQAEYEATTARIDVCAVCGQPRVVKTAE